MTDVRATDWDLLPGIDLVRNGIDDLRAREDTTNAALIGMARTRLIELGIDVPSWEWPEPAGHHLYGLLATQQRSTAHSQYNALVARLTSFLHAAQRAPTS